MCHNISNCTPKHTNNPNDLLCRSKQIHTQTNTEVDQTESPTATATTPTTFTNEHYNVHNNYNDNNKCNIVLRKTLTEMNCSNDLVFQSVAFSGKLDCLCSPLHSYISEQFVVLHLVQLAIHIYIYIYLIAKLTFCCYCFICYIHICTCLCTCIYV